MTAFDYAPAPESPSVVDIASSYGLFINGEFTDATSGESLKTINPATEENLADVAVAGTDDVERAVRAARTAYERTWGRCLAPSGPSTCSGSRGYWPSDPGSSPCWKCWTTANRSVRPGIWTSRWPRRTSST